MERNNNMAVAQQNSVRAVFEELQNVITRLQSGENRPHTVVSESRGHVLVGIETAARSSEPQEVQSR